jgi:hypothetical protein
MGDYLGPKPVSGSIREYISVEIDAGGQKVPQPKDKGQAENYKRVEIVLAVFFFHRG